MKTQSEPSRERADVGLREAELDEGMPEAGLVHRLDPRSIVAEVRQVHPVRDDPIAEIRGERPERRTEFLAAEIATIRRILDVAVVRQLRYADHLHRNPDLGGLAERLIELASSQGFRVPDHADRVPAP